PIIFSSHIPARTVSDPLSLHDALPILTRPTLKGWQLLLKRLVDLVGATSGLLLLSPMFGLVALVVKLESRGAAVFEVDDQRDERSEEHTSELQSRGHLVCRRSLEKKNQ